MTDSCFVTRLQHYLPLTPAETDALVTLEDNPEVVRAGETLFEEGEPMDMLALVKTGWMISSTLLRDGARQILRVHLDGDLLNPTTVSWTESACTVTAALDSVVCRFPRRALTAIFDDHPRLAALFFAVAMVETVDLCDRLRAIGRTNGKARLAQFFLSTLARQNVTGRVGEETLTLPLTQADLADAVGLTNIHVNRLLRELDEERLIERSRGAVTVLKPADLGRLAQWTDRFGRLDTSWFPAAA